MRRAGAALIVAALLGACAGCGLASPAAAPSGCEQVVNGVPGRVLPETSGFSCAEIRESIAALPPETGGFLLESGILQGWWKCHRYAPAENGVLLRCTRHQKRFSIVKR